MNYFVPIKLFISFRGESGIRTRGTLLEYTHFPGVLLKPRGIRTRGTLLEYTHFPGVLLKPLGHLSSACLTPLPYLKSLPKVHNFSFGKQKYLIFSCNKFSIA